MKDALISFAKTHQIPVMNEPAFANRLRADVAFLLEDKIVICDVTITNTRAKTWRNKSQDEIERIKEDAKKKLYGDEAESVGADFCVLHFDVLGGFSNASIKLIKELSRRADKQPEHLTNQIAGIIQRWNGRILISMRGRRAINHAMQC